MTCPAMLPDISARSTSAGGVCNGAGAGMLGSSSRDCAIASKTARASLAGSMTVQAAMAAALLRTGLVKLKELTGKQSEVLDLGCLGLLPLSFINAAYCGVRESARTNTQGKAMARGPENGTTGSQSAPCSVLGVLLFPDKLDLVELGAGFCRWHGRLELLGRRAFQCVLFSASGA